MSSSATVKKHELKKKRVQKVNRQWKGKRKKGLGDASKWTKQAAPIAALSSLNPSFVPSIAVNESYRARGEGDRGRARSSLGESESEMAGCRRRQKKKANSTGAFARRLSLLLRALGRCEGGCQRSRHRVLLRRREAEATWANAPVFFWKTRRVESIERVTK